jgi:hypothetical protein
LIALVRQIRNKVPETRSILEVSGSQNGASAGQNSQPLAFPPVKSVKSLNLWSLVA